jgi:hypothetical protein
MRIAYALIVAMLLPATLAVAAEDLMSYEPQITLFESVEVVKQYVARKAEGDYSDKFLRSVSLQHSEGHPRKGDCWLYHFAFKKPRLGRDISIYHFMDNKVIEFRHGP